MAKRRRKLSKELEKEISLILKKLELVTALINDINEEELQGEYIVGFSPVKEAVAILKYEYDTNGLTENAEKALNSYKILIDDFESSYEL